MAPAGLWKDHGHKSVCSELVQDAFGQFRMQDFCLPCMDRTRFNHSVCPTDGACVSPEPLTAAQDRCPVAGHLCPPYLPWVVLWEGIRKVCWWGEYMTAASIVAWWLMAGSEGTHRQGRRCMPP